MGFWDKLKGVDRNLGETYAARAFGGPGWRERMRADELKNKQTEAQTGLIGAETARAQAGTTTEQSRNEEIQLRMEEVRKAREEWDTAVKSGLLKGQNAEVQKALIDAAEADVRKKASEAAVVASGAAAAHSRAQTRRLEDPTLRALELAQLRDSMHYRRAQTAAAEALTANRERGPARPPNTNAQLAAENFAAENVNRGQSRGFLGMGRTPGYLEENTPEYAKRVGELKKQYYQLNPETAGGWSAGGGNLSDQAGAGSIAGAANLPDGIYNDSATGKLFAVKGGQVIELRDQPTRGGLGVPSPTVNPENDF